MSRGEGIIPYNNYLRGYFVGLLGVSSFFLLPFHFLHRHPFIGLKFVLAFCVCLDLSCDKFADSSAQILQLPLRTHHHNNDSSNNRNNDDDDAGDDAT